MQTNDRLRIFRSLGLALAALLLVGGAVFASNAANGVKHVSDASGPGASAEQNDANGGQDNQASESPEASESPGQDVNDLTGNDAPEATARQDAENSAEATESPEASESEGPDDNGGNSGHGGDGLSHD